MVEVSMLHRCRYYPFDLSQSIVLQNKKYFMLKSIFLFQNLIFYMLIILQNECFFIGHLPGFYAINFVFRVQGLPDSGVLYGYRIDGPRDWKQGHRFDCNIILLDPYAKLVDGRKLFGDVRNKMLKFLGTYDFSSLPFDWGPNYKLPSIPEVGLKCCICMVSHVGLCIHLYAYDADRSCHI